MKINGIEYVTRADFDELHRWNMSLLDAIKVDPHELAEIRERHNNMANLLSYAQCLSCGSSAISKKKRKCLWCFRVKEALGGAGGAHA